MTRHIRNSMRPSVAAVVPEVGPVAASSWAWWNGTYSGDPTTGARVINQWTKTGGTSDVFQDIPNYGAAYILFSTPGLYMMSAQSFWNSDGVGVRGVYVRAYTFDGYLGNEVPANSTRALAVVGTPTLVFPIDPIDLELVGYQSCSVEISSYGTGATSAEVRLHVARIG